MTQELITALAVFAFISSITPGPNNLMLMSSGANFGIARTVPHMLGVGIGFTVMIILVGLGIAGVFAIVPGSALALKVLSALYLAYLAWKIAGASAPSTAQDQSTKQPMTFLQAAAFQWVNPKAWAMALTAVGAYTAPNAPLISLFIVALVFGLINLPSVSLWTVVGTGMRTFLTSQARLRAFNWTCAALLIATIWPIVKSTAL